MHFILATIAVCFFSLSSLGSIDIFLLEDETLSAYDIENIPLNQLQLKSVPLLGSDQIVTYNWANHELSIDKGIILPDCGVYGKPFVVVLDGKRKYRGSFWTLISSMSFSRPVIEIPIPNHRVNQITIKRAYPGDSFGRGVDPRNNDDIRNKLEKDGKLLLR